MQCPVQNRDNADLLLAYCARRLDSEAAAVLERHMQQCEACRAFGEAQKVVWAALDAWEAQPLTEEFDRRLYARIRQDEEGGFWSRWVRPRLPLNPRPAISLAVAASVLMVALLVQSPPGSRLAEVEIVDAEQVEGALDDLEMLWQVNLTPKAEPTVTQAM